MFQWLSRLHEWATRRPVYRVDDPVLGELVINETYWECTIAAESGPIVLGVGGRYEPDTALIESARNTFLRIDEFVGEVKAHLKAESEKGWEPASEELNSLTISSVGYYWPKQPNSGLIFFDGPDECKAWRCEINGEQISGLTFDT